MRARRLLLAALVTVAACAGSGAGQRDDRGARAGGHQHPAVDVGLATCSSCHAQATPQVAAQWRDGRHGLSLVECMVCHGSTGADFKARPGTTACVGCHAEQVQSASASCFSCHKPHALVAAGRMPHLAKPKEASR